MSLRHEVLLAFDFGLRRIGIATGNSLTRTATPVTTLETRDALPWKAIDELIAEWEPTCLVVGVPNRQGNTDVLEQIDAFVVALGERYRLRVVTVDESLTSHAARDHLRDGRRSGFLRRRVDKVRLDAQAARLIAEQWMNEDPQRSNE